MRSIVWSGLSLFLIASRAFAQNSPGLNEQPIVIYECPIQPFDDLRVPVEVGGILAEVNVKEGDLVNVDQMLAKVKDDKARIEYEAQKVAAENKFPEAEAFAKLEEAKARASNSKQLVSRGAESLEKLRQDEATVKVAEAMHENAKVQSTLELNKLNLKAEEVLQHEVKSPISGRIVEIIGKKGQALEPLAPIFRIANTQKVRIKGSIDLLNADRIKEGMYLEAYPDITEGPVITLLGHTAGVTSVVVLPGNERCVSAGKDGLIIEWDIRRRVKLRIFEEHDQTVTSLAVSPSNPDQLISGDLKGNIFIWDLAKGEVAKKITTTGDGIKCLTLSPTEPNLCIVSHEDRMIRLWDLKTGEKKGTLTGHRSYATSLAITPDGKELVSAGDDQTVRFWDLPKRELIRTDKGRSESVQYIGLSDDGKSYLFNSFGNLEIRSVADGRPLSKSFTNPKGVFSQVALFAPKSNLVLAGTSNDELELWKDGEGARQARLVRRYRGHSDLVRSVDFSSDGSFFVSGGDDRTVKIWLVPTLEQIAKEKLIGRVDFVNPIVETSQRNMLADIDNVGEVLTPGRMATLVIYPAEQAQVAESKPASLPEATERPVVRTIESEPRPLQTSEPADRLPPIKP